jgi:lipopolysaccharide/colanic/teichoic acid biosynthesis glycosyltransferase
MTKRVVDLTVAALGLVTLAPLFMVVAVLIKLDSPGAVFFRQERMGRSFRPFRIYKFRTMVADAPLRGAPITPAGDPRITRVGALLRRTKVDELPQLLNVLKGEMSLVGPRPEVRRYVEMFRADYAQILTVRPGITDLASLAYVDEASVLCRAADPQQEYVDRVLPEKIALAKQYLARASLPFDCRLVLATLGRILSSRAA